MLRTAEWAHFLTDDTVNRVFNIIHGVEIPMDMDTNNIYHHANLLLVQGKSSWHLQRFAEGSPEASGVGTPKSSQDERK